MIVTESLVIELARNVAILSALTFVYSQLQQRLHKRSLALQRLLMGGVFGLFAVLVMLTPIMVNEIRFDGRIIMLSLAGAFGGPVAATITAIITLIANLALYGEIALLSLLVTLSSALIGVILHRQQRQTFPIYDSNQLVTLGAALAVQRLTWQFIFGQLDVSTALLLLPMYALYPCGTLLVGALLSLQYRQNRLKDDLMQQHTLLRKLIDTLPDYIFVKDNHGRFLVSNLAHAGAVGVTPDELVGKTAREFFPPELAAQYDVDDAALLRTGVPLLNAERRTLDDHGGEKWVLTTKVVFHDPDGKPGGIIGISRDITERKQAEDHLLQSTEVIARFSYHLREVHRIATTTYTSLDALFNDCVQVGCEIFNMTTGIISEIEGDRFTIRAVQSEIPILALGLELALEHTYCHRVVQNPHTTIIPQVGRLPEMLTHPVYQQHRLEAYICTPIQVNGRIYGTLSFFHTAPRANGFEPHEIELIELMARTISYFISTTQTQTALRESEQRYRSVVASLDSGIVLQLADGRVVASNASAQRILGLTEAQLMGLTSIDPRWHSIHEDGSPFPGEDHPAMVTLRTGEPQHEVIMGVNKSDESQAWLSINTQPMFRPGETQPFAVVVAFADITRRRRAEEDQVRYIHLLETLHRVDSALSETLDKRTVLELALQMTQKISGADHGFVALVEGDSLRVLRAVGGYMAGEVLSLSEGVIGRCIRERQPAKVDDVRADLSYIPHCENTRVQMSFPLVAHNELLGVLNLEAEQPGAFSRDVYDVIKLFSARLATAIENARLYDTVQTQLSELTALHDQTLYHAEHDYLTRLANRQKVEKSLQEALANNEDGEMVGLLYIDLDRFKVINDTYGHATGDAFLCQVAQRLERCTKIDTDVLGRLGGDEFVLMMTRVRSRDALIARAQQILETLREPVIIGELELRVSASIGISMYPHDGADMRTLLRKADAALYHSKHEGRNTFRLSTCHDSADDDNNVLENALHHALGRGEISLHYQPQIDLRTGVLVGMEALMRWTHPTLGSIPPGRFIPLAEESGLIVELGDWALREACEQGVAWQQSGYAPVRIAVNVSALQFQRDDFVDGVVHALDASGLQPHLLEIEITESVLMRHEEHSNRRIKQLRALGVSIAIDDFGTGYSSLRYLQQMPIDTLKIDRSFIAALSETDTGGLNNRAIVQAIIQLAHHLQKKVVAEGVETEDQAAFLQAARCNMVQGYMISPPLSITQLEPFMALIRSQSFLREGAYALGG